MLTTQYKNTLQVLAIGLFITIATVSATVLFVPAVVRGEELNLQGSACKGTDLSLGVAAKNECTNAGECTKRATADDPNSACTETKSESSLNKLVTTIVNILSVIVGVIAVIFVIIGGAKFITSGGDSGKVSSAKSTVIYAIVGLIIVALAQIIVKFVLSKAA